MKNTIKAVTIIVISTTLLLVGISNVNGFGQQDKENVFYSHSKGEEWQLEGTKSITSCTDVGYTLEIWNDPIPGEYVTNLRTKVSIPSKFNSSKSYDAKAENFALAQTGDTISEFDIDTLKWNDSAIGKSQKYVPNTASLIFGKYVNGSYVYTNPTTLPNSGYTITTNNDIHTLDFNNLVISNVFDGKLYQNDYVQIRFYMRVGDNCIDASKELISNANTIYKAGDKVDYKLTVKNTGSYDYKDIKFSDTFDTNAYSSVLSDISLTKTTGDLDVSNITYTNSILNADLTGTLKSGSTSTFKLTLTIKTGFTSQIACNLTASYVGFDYYHIFNPSGSVNMVGNLCVNLTQPTPGLGINKEIVGSDLSQVNYKITLTNTGTVTLSSLAITDLYDETKYVFFSSNPASNSAGNGVVSIVNLGNLAPGAKKEVFISFRFANNLVDGQACNKEVNATASYTSGSSENLTISSKFEPDICIETPRSAIEVVKRLSTSSSKQIIYTVDITNKGALDLNNINILDIFDNTRLSVKSVEVANEVVNGDRFTITNLLNVALKANEKATFVITFDVLAKAPAGLACNKEISVSAKDTLNRTVNASQVLEQNTVNCVNLIIIENKKPNLSVSKRLVSKTDAIVTDTVQWEIVTTNICIGNDCEVADRVAFRDYFSSTNLKFNSAFAQLKNADGSNVNASPIAFTPVITSENGNTVLTYSDLTEIVGNVSAGQYIVVEIYTTALKTNSSCVNNTVTISGPNNSVSAQACVNIVTKYTPSDNKDRLPNTDILDSLSVLMGAPTSLKIAFLILALAIGVGTTVPTVLLVKAKKNN